MYADMSDVLTLCINVRGGVDTGFVSVQAALVDAYIDARLSEAFFWPNAQDGTPLNTPPPPLVKEIANHLTAAKVERIKFGMNEASGQIEGNPYARGLEREAMKMLEQLVGGELVIPELQENSPIRQSSMPSSFIPVQGSGFGRRMGLGGTRGR